MKKKIIIILAFAVIVVPFLSSKEIEAQNTVDYTKMTNSEFIEYVNNDSVLLGQVRGIMQNSMPTVENEPITEEELELVMQSGIEQGNQLALYIPGGWNFEFYSNTLVETIDEAEHYPYPDFEVVQMYSARKNMDWSWLDFFLKEDLKIAVHLQYFTETDFYMLRNGNFYDVSNQQLFSVDLGGYARVNNLNLNEYLPIALLSPKYENDEQSRINMYAFGGRFNLDISEANYTTISSNNENQFNTNTFIAPDGKEYPMNLYFMTGYSIILLDNGVFLYYDENNLELEFGYNTDRMYYSKRLMSDSHFLEGTNTKNAYPQPIAFYKVSDDWKGITLDTTSEVKYFNENGNLISSTITPNYFYDLSGREFKWGGPRNMAMPLMIYLDFYSEQTSTDNLRWYVSTSYWQPLFNFQKTQGAPVSVRHVDEEQNEIANTVVLNGFIGESFTGEPISIPNYEVIGIPAEISGTFTNEPQELIFVYRRIDDKDVDENDESTDNQKNDQNDRTDNESNNDGTLANNGTNDTVSDTVNTGDTVQLKVIIALLVTSSTLTTIFGAKKYRARRK
ncbi:MucBP domain-containing protein [Breznakia pachnodae]|uniref:MucBP domain-containing protein n=1 Tax=Breznakia pachnodae TaxID=265178 RepID=A0ABU0E8U3_9FIRM|nr:MucBP domain-containing protein [Breznakia pachnodae]MDQ0363309.1 hypothetical protein [Breznakia pachnodae]